MNYKNIYNIFLIYFCINRVHSFDWKLPNVSISNIKNYLSEIPFPKITKDSFTNFYDTNNDTNIPSEENNGTCYENLGCFPNKYPWYSLLRPLPPPQSPNKINVKLYYYSRENTNRSVVTLYPNIEIPLGFDITKLYTVFIVHGFSSNGNNSWLDDLKNAYLKKRDANVFLVDWGDGANNINYLQVASNTRIVGSELTRFGKFLLNNNYTSLNKIHLIGHSLGSHISAYFAKGINNYDKINRITALDPAQPGFEKCSSEVRLDKNDAKYVDVVHTNTRPIIPLLGFGFIGPVGHNDYYMNGGVSQPGCKTPTIIPKLSNIKDLKQLPLETISEWVACSHGRSYQYFIESILNDYCKFWGRKTGLVGTISDVLTFGKSEEIINKLKKCTNETCSPLSLESYEYPARGSFIISTHSSKPFCNSVE
jgi:hypothetical protein